MARVNEGSHSFTCHPQVYPQVEWTIPAFTPQLQSFTALWLQYELQFNDCFPGKPVQHGIDWVKVLHPTRHKI